MAPNIPVQDGVAYTAPDDLDGHDEVGVVKAYPWLFAYGRRAFEEKGTQGTLDGGAFQTSLHPPEPAANVETLAGKAVAGTIQCQAQGLCHIGPLEWDHPFERLYTHQAAVKSGQFGQLCHATGKRAGAGPGKSDEHPRVARRTELAQRHQRLDSSPRHAMASNGHHVPVAVVDHGRDYPGGQLCSQPRPRLIVAAMGEILRAARPAGVLLALLALVLILATGCGAGGGTATALPAGGATTAVDGNKVLYVAQAQGNRIDAYRLGSDGLLVVEPFSTLAVNNPRRLTVSGDVLYASLGTAVGSLPLASDGSLPAQTTASTAESILASPMEILVRNGILYVAMSGLSEIQAYDLDSAGHVGEDTLSTSGGSFRNYRTLATYGDYMYAAARGSFTIDTYIIQSDGSLPETFETQLPMPAITMPDDITIDNGTIYTVDQNNERIKAYIIQSDGLLPSSANSKTEAAERYTDLLISGGRLYATAYSAGRIDMYLLEDDGSLPSGPPVASTHADTATFPSALAFSEAVIYVAQAGLGRVDAYLTGANGSPGSFPSSSTRAVAGSFPTDIEIYTLP